MLIVARYEGESIIVADTTGLVIVSVGIVRSGKRVKLGVVADPQAIIVDRDEVWPRRLAEIQEARRNSDAA